ncbi:MAG: type II toxin-antitoxin system VapC family toxin [Rhodospirillales bacterium]
MNGFLLDTNVLSELARAPAGSRGARWADRQARASLYISDVTVGEIHKGIAKLAPSRRREGFEVWLQRVLLVDFQDRILPSDRRVWATWGRITGEALRRGKPMPVIDALLVATAIEHNLVLATRDRALAKMAPAAVNPWRP